jgi:hypothetical protein
VVAGEVLQFREPVDERRSEKEHCGERRAWLERRPAAEPDEQGDDAADNGEHVAQAGPSVSRMQLKSPGYRSCSNHPPTSATGTTSAGSTPLTLAPSARKPCQSGNA